MAIDYHKQGKRNKEKGKDYERRSAKFWTKELELDKDKCEIKRTPCSGSFAGYPADLFCYPDNPKWRFTVDVKSGKSAVPKKIKEQIEKLDSEAEHNIHWLEMYIQDDKDPVCVIRRSDLAKLIKNYIINKKTSKKAKIN